MDDAIRQLYMVETRERVAGLRSTLAVLATSQTELREAEVHERRMSPRGGDPTYDAFLHAHTMKGTSMQLGVDDVTAVADEAVELLRGVHRSGELPDAVLRRLGAICDAVERWLDADMTGPLDA